MKRENSIATRSKSKTKPEDVKRELLLLSLPALAGQAIDPLAQLMETAYIGRLALGLGIFEALALSLGSGVFLHIIGVSTQNPTHVSARQFLSLRAIGAPAVVLSLALQGIFRGFKDTKTPVICLGKCIGNFSLSFYFPYLCITFGWCNGCSHFHSSLSIYGTVLMIWYLNKRAELLPPKMGDLQFGCYIKSGGFLIGRTLAVLSTITLGTSMAARYGPVAMAAHQICMQVWLAVSLLTDALATSGQALIASSVSRHEYKVVKEITSFVLRIGMVMGICLTAILGASFGSLATIFTHDSEVLQVVRTLGLFVSASQPFNSLAYIFDGLHYGVSDFQYAALSMGVWLGLTLFMALRAATGCVRA
ncbi:MATE efflux family protein 3 [Spatholobus suberectus]|nr:MATE efflux family protein 3 [Spatholobus suberectus]